MSVSAATLAELHRIHRQMTDLRSRLERGPRQIKHAQANVENVAQELEVAKQAVLRTRVNVDQKELQLKERESRILDVRAKLNTCSTNREYQAFVEQIAADEQANSVLSDEILELFDKVVELEQAAEGVKERQAAIDRERLAVQQRVDESRVTLENEVGRLNEQLELAEAKLPADYRKDYQRLVKARGEEALAPLEGENCGGCYQRVTTQTINELMMSKPISCEACGCLLYIPEGSGGGDES